MRLEADVSGVRSSVAAVTAAKAVFECRVAVERALQSGSTGGLDKELHALEMAYYRRADSLKKKPTVTRRGRGKR